MLFAVIEFRCAVIFPRAAATWRLLGSRYWRQPLSAT
jgi:hypothetical protein